VNSSNQRAPAGTAVRYLRPKKISAPSIALMAVVAVLLGTTVVGCFLLDTKGIDTGAATAKFIGELAKMFARPVARHFSFAEALWALVLTLALGFLTTIIGASLALAVGPFAAKNLSPAPVVATLKAFVALVRAIPTVLWVLIFAIGAGLGSVAAVVGMTFHSFSYLLKAYSEAFEEIDSDVIEALKATGANWLQIVFQAVLPSAISSLLSWTFMRFEINFTNAVAMGAAAGAGGIGFDLFMASGFYFDIREVGYITWLILAVAVALEITATRLERFNHTER
jgi:phosphonate transport system permease protein